MIRFRTSVGPDREQWDTQSRKYIILYKVKGPTPEELRSFVDLPDATFGAGGSRIGHRLSANFVTLIFSVWMVREEGSFLLREILQKL